MIIFVKYNKGNDFLKCSEINNCALTCTNPCSGPNFSGDSVVALSCHGEDAPKHFTLVPSLWSNMFSVSSVISLPIKLR